MVLFLFRAEGKRAEGQGQRAEGIIRRNLVATGYERLLYPLHEVHCICAIVQFFACVIVQINNYRFR